MQKQLQELQRILRFLENDINSTMKFYEFKSGDKYSFFCDILHQTLHDTEKGQPCLYIDEKTKQTLTYLNSRYMNSQRDYCYQSHMCHFHMSLKDWVNCPMTCISELEEFVGKILKGN